MKNWPHLYSQWLRLVLVNYKIQVFQKNSEIFLVVDPLFIKDVFFFLKNHSNCQYQSLSDIAGSDFPQRSKRFQVSYQLVSHRFNHRLTVVTNLRTQDSLYSITSLFPAASWYEREVFDIFGVNFYNHPDIRRILTDYGFEGHPLRKDFPLNGFVEVCYDTEKKRIICEPVEFSQEFRMFSFSPKKRWLYNFKNIKLL